MPRLTLTASFRKARCRACGSTPRWSTPWPTTAGANAVSASCRTRSGKSRAASAPAWTSRPICSPPMPRQTTRNPRDWTRCWTATSVPSSIPRGVRAATKSSPWTNIPISRSTSPKPWRTSASTTSPVPVPTACPQPGASRPVPTATRGAKSPRSPRNCPQTSARPTPRPTSPWAAPVPTCVSSRPVQRIRTISVWPSSNFTASSYPSVPTACWYTLRSTLSTGIPTDAPCGHRLTGSLTMPPRCRALTSTWKAGR